MTTPTPRTDELLRKIDALRAIRGWIDGVDIDRCAELLRMLERDLAARESELAELMKWKEAVVNELIVAHIYSQAHDDSPRKAVHDAITWHCQ